MPAGLAAATGKNDPLCHDLPSLSGLVRLTASTTRATSPDFDVSPRTGRTFAPAAAAVVTSSSGIHKSFLAPRHRPAAKKGVDARTALPAFPSVGKKGGGVVQRTDDLTARQLPLQPLRIRNPPRRPFQIG